MIFHVPGNDHKMRAGSGTKQARRRLVTAPAPPKHKTARDYLEFMKLRVSYLYINVCSQTNHQPQREGGSTERVVRLALTLDPSLSPVGSPATFACRTMSQISCKHAVLGDMMIQARGSTLPAKWEQDRI